MNSGRSFIQVRPWAVYCIVVPLALMGLGIDLWVIVEHSKTNTHATEVIYTWWDVSFTLVNAFITALVAYLMARFLLRQTESEERKKELQNTVLMPLRVDILTNKCSTSSTLSSIDWAFLFEGTTEICLLVQGWDKWPTQLVSHHLEKFVRAGGKITLIVYDHENVALLTPHSERLGRNLSAIKQEIIWTITNLWDELEKYLNNDTEIQNRMTLYQMCKTNWYCGIHFQPGKSLLSPYQHQHNNSLPLLLRLMTLISKTFERGSPQN